MSRRSSVTRIDDPRLFKALTHPLRVRILALLDERVSSPRELSEQLDASLGTVSYHVRTLLELGLIELVRTTQVRGAIAHHYRSVKRPRVTEEAWEQAAPMVKQAAVGAALQTIDAYAHAAAAAGGFDRPEAQLGRTTLQLDGKGWEQAARACERLLERLHAIEDAAAARLAKNGQPAESAAVAVMLFDAVRLSEPS